MFVANLKSVESNLNLVSETLKIEILFYFQIFLEDPGL